MIKKEKELSKEELKHVVGGQEVDVADKAYEILSRMVTGRDATTIGERTGITFV